MEEHAEAAAGQERRGAAINDGVKGGYSHARHRLIRAVLIGVVMLVAEVASAPLRAQPSDFAQIWYAARAWLHHVDPYSVVGPGRAFEWGVPLLYPMPAVLTAVPFAPFPIAVADAIFVGLGAGLLAWTLMRKRLDDPRLLVFLSAAGVAAAQTAQWSPLLSAATFIPPSPFYSCVSPRWGSPSSRCGPAGHWSCPQFSSGS